MLLIGITTGYDLDLQYYFSTRMLSFVDGYILFCHAAKLEAEGIFGPCGRKTIEWNLLARQM